MVGQLSSRTRHRVLAVAALDKSLNMVWMSGTWTAEETYFVLALFVLKGTVQKPSVRQYLSQNQLAATPVFGSVIALDRFEIICRFPHFISKVSKDASEGPQNLFKIYPTIRHLNSKFQDLYLPQQDTSADESRMLWKGCLYFTK